MSARVVALTIAPLALIAVAVAGIAGSTKPPDARKPDRPVLREPSRSPAAVAIDFLAGLTLERLVDRRARETYLARRVAPGSLAALRQLYAEEADRLRQSSESDRFSRAAVFGYRVQRRAASAADVLVWAASVGASGNAPVAVGWRTIRVSLARAETRWSVTAVEETPGPSPELASEEFMATAMRFRGVHAAP